MLDPLRLHSCAKQTANMLLSGMTELAHVQLVLIFLGGVGES